MRARLKYDLLLGALVLYSVFNWPITVHAEAAELLQPTPGAIDLQTLDGLRGGTEVAIANESSLEGTVRGNTARDVITGSNMITEGSLAGMNGFATVVQNSGNNVLIQNSTIINLQVQ